MLNDVIFLSPSGDALQDIINRVLALSCKSLIIVKDETFESSRLYNWEVRDAKAGQTPADKKLNVVWSQVPFVPQEWLNDVEILVLNRSVSVMEYLFLLTRLPNLRFAVLFGDLYGIVRSHKTFSAKCRREQIFELVENRDIPDLEWNSTATPECSAFTSLAWPTVDAHAAPTWKCCDFCSDASWITAQRLPPMKRGRGRPRKYPRKEDELSPFAAYGSAKLEIEEHLNESEQEVVKAILEDNAQAFSDASGLELIEAFRKAAQQTPSNAAVCNKMIGLIPAGTGLALCHRLFFWDKKGAVGDVDGDESKDKDAMDAKTADDATMALILAMRANDEEEDDDAGADGDVGRNRRKAARRAKAMAARIVVDEEDEEEEETSNKRAKNLHGGAHMARMSMGRMAGPRSPSAAGGMGLDPSLMFPFGMPPKGALGVPPGSNPMNQLLMNPGSINPAIFNMLRNPSPYPFLGAPGAFGMMPPFLTGAIPGGPQQMGQPPSMDSSGAPPPGAEDQKPVQDSA